MRATLTEEVKAAQAAGKRSISAGRRHYIEVSRKLDRIFGKDRQLAMPSRNDSIKQGEREIYQAKSLTVY